MERINLFVPGRLCLFGEHSDWAGKYRSMNSALVAGEALVTGTEQGIYATVEKSENFEMTSTAESLRDVWQDFECPMNAEALKEVARSGSFFAYCAGVASYMLEWYGMGGGKDKYRQDDLAAEKRTFIQRSDLCARLQSIQ